jgi:hypothetical protein
MNRLRISVCVRILTYPSWVTKQPTGERLTSAVSEAAVRNRDQLTWRVRSQVRRQGGRGGLVGERGADPLREVVAAFRRVDPDGQLATAALRAARAAVSCIGRCARRFPLKIVPLVLVARLKGRPDGV